MLPHMISAHESAATGWFVDRVRDTALAPPPRTGRMTLVEREVSRRALMPPLHAHEDDVSYYVLSGSLTFFVGDEIVPARGGEVVVVPRDVPHTFRVESDRARFHVLARVSSARAFEDFGLALAEAADEWASDEEREAVGALAAGAGIRVLGPPGMLPAALAA